MNIGKMLSKTEKLITDNSPLILTAVGVAGTVATGVLAAKAAFKAAEAIVNETERVNIENGVEEVAEYEPLERKEIVKLTWLYFLPPVGIAAGTVGAIIMSNRISTRRAAALAAAYVAGEKSWEEYKEKVKQHLGVAKEEKVSAEVSQDRVNSTPPSATGIIHTGNGNDLFCDGFSGRYFYSSLEAVKKAENSINKQIHASDYASLSNYYSALGLRPTQMSDDFGWTSDTKWLEVDYSTTTTADERVACHYLKYSVLPMRDFR